MIPELELSPSVASDLTVRNSVETSTLVLQDVIKNSPRQLHVRWDRPVDQRYREFVTIEMSDGESSASDTLRIDDLDSISKLRLRFSRLYGDFLAKRSQLLLQPVGGADGAELQ